MGHWICLISPFYMWIGQWWILLYHWISYDLCCQKQPMLVFALNTFLTLNLDEINGDLISMSTPSIVLFIPNWMPIVTYVNSCEVHSKFYWGQGKGWVIIDLFDWRIAYKHFNMDIPQIEDYVSNLFIKFPSSSPIYFQ